MDPVVFDDDPARPVENLSDEPDPPRRARLPRRVLAGLVAAGLVAVALHVVLARGDAARPAARPVARSTVHASVAADGIECWQSGACGLRFGVPRAVRQALWQRLPGTSGIGVFTTVHPGARLFARQVTAGRGPAEVLVQVRRRGEAGGLHYLPSGFGQRSVQVSGALPGYTVVVQWVGPSGFVVPLPALRALAHDRRLTAAG